MIRFISLVGFVIALLSSCSDTNVSNTDSKKILTYTDSLELTIQLTKLKELSTLNEDTLFVVAEEVINRLPKRNTAYVSIKLAHVFYAKAKLYLSRYYFTRAADIYEKDGMKQQYAEQLTNIGVLNELMGDYPKAIDNYFKALSIFDELDMGVKKTSVYNNLGIVYQHLGKFEKSIEYYKKSIAGLKNDSKKNLLLGSKYNNIATVFEEYENQLDSALYYYYKAYNTYSETSSNVNVPLIVANIANIYIYKNNLHKADSLLYYASQLSTKNNLKFATHTINRFYARLRMMQGNYSEAEVIAKKIIDITNKESIKESEIDAYKVLIESYELQGDFKSSYMNLKKQVKLKDELVGIEQQSEIDKLNVRYDVQKKDNKIRILELENQVNQRKTKIWRLMGLLGLLILISLLSWLYIINLNKNHAELKIKSMQRDIKDYIQQLHDFESEEKERKLSEEDLFLEKIERFNLSNREKEVLIYISKGYKNTEIAETLFVSINTVKHHIKNIFLKLDVNNRMDAVQKAKVK